MTQQFFINNYETVLTKPAGAGDSVLFLEDVSRLPSIDTEGFFKLTLVRESDEAKEIIKVVQVNPSNNSVTVQRNQEGTFPLGLSVGDRVSMNLTAGDLTDFENRKKQYEDALEYLNAQILPDATETEAGILEIATNSESLTGTDHTRAVTPVKMKHVMDNRTDLGEITRYQDGVFFDSVTVTPYTIDRSLGSIHKLTLVTNCTLSFSMQNGDSVLLALLGGASFTVTWDSVDWFGEDVPVLTDGEFIQLWKINNQIYGKHVGFASLGFIQPEQVLFQELFNDLSIWTNESPANFYVDNSELVATDLSNAVNKNLSTTISPSLDITKVTKITFDFNAFDDGIGDSPNISFTGYVSFRPIREQLVDSAKRPLLAGQLIGTTQVDINKWYSVELIVNGSNIDFSIVDRDTQVEFISGTVAVTPGNITGVNFNTQDGSSYSGGMGVRYDNIEIIGTI